MSVDLYVWFLITQLIVGMGAYPAMGQTGTLPQNECFKQLVCFLKTHGWNMPNYTHTLFNAYKHSCTHSCTHSYTHSCTQTQGWTFALDWIGLPQPLDRVWVQYACLITLKRDNELKIIYRSLLVLWNSAALLDRDCNNKILDCYFLSRTSALLMLKRLCRIGILLHIRP